MRALLLVEQARRDPSARSGAVKEVQVESIRVNMKNFRRTLMLQETDGFRVVPTWFGHVEADAIGIFTLGLS